MPRAELSPPSLVAVDTWLGGTSQSRERRELEDPASCLPNDRGQYSPERGYGGCPRRESDHQRQSRSTRYAYPLARRRSCRRWSASAALQVAPAAVRQGPGSCGEYQYWHDGKCVDARQKTPGSW